MKVTPENQLTNSDSTDSLFSNKSTTPEEKSTNSDNSVSSYELFTSPQIAENINLLKLAYNFIFDQLETPQEQKSQAQLEDEARYKKLKDSINRIVSQYDTEITKKGSDIEKILAFENNLSRDHSPLTSENINRLRASLEAQEFIPSSNTTPETAKQKALELRRKALGFAAGLFLKEKDIVKLEKLSKDKKSKLKLIQECFELENQINFARKFLDKPEKLAKFEETYKKRYAQINTAFIDISLKEKDREKRNIWMILASQTQKEQLLSSQTAEQIANSIAHPFTKILNDPNLSNFEKAWRTPLKLGKKTIDGLQFATEKAIQTPKFLVKHSIKQPTMAAYRFTSSMINAAEYLTLQTQALTEKSPSKKEEFQKQAQIKLKNLTYHEEKFIRALAASGGIALIDAAFLASIGSVGIAAPSISGIHSTITNTLLATADAADKLQNTKDTLDAIGERLEIVNEKVEMMNESRKQRRGNASIHSVVYLREKISTGTMPIIDSVYIQPSTIEKKSILPLSSAKVMPEGIINKAKESNKKTTFFSPPNFSFKTKIHPERAK